MPAKGYPAYQCFKDKARNVYCSKTTFKNHATGAAWVTSALAHFKIKANDISGKPYLEDKIPSGAETL